MPTDRRGFLKRIAGLGALAALHRLGLVDSWAAPGTEYRALVCVFLFGGNDGNNAIVPLDGRYAEYAAVRGALAVAREEAVPLVPSSGAATFGLHPALSALQPLWEAGALTAVFNAGTLVAPLTRESYPTGPRPENLFSHSDQQQQWQTASSVGVLRTGWAGRIADSLAGGNGAAAIPCAVSTAGNHVLLAGDRTVPLILPAGGTFGLEGFGTDPASIARKNALQELQAAAASEPALPRALADVAARSLVQSEVMTSVLSETSPALATAFSGPTTTLSQQLLQVAKVIEARSALGVTRQIFFVSLGGFDTHSDQSARQGVLFGQLGPALKAFYDATAALGVAQSVATFTLSDFGRTLKVNSRGGTDHGWGNHHFVLGGAVRGRQFYGTFPTPALAGPDDADVAGRWIPTLAVEQYAGTLATWLGVPAADLDSAFPNRKRFDTTPVGFLA